ncbi:MAG: RidA family protein [Candidatus Lokiarchaeota archaeon]
MNSKKVINIDLPKAGPYNHAIQLNDLIFLSGQVADKGIKGIRDQTKSVLNKIKKILEEIGSSVADILKVSVFLKDMDNFKVMNKAYQEFFEENEVTEAFPARTTVGIAQLPLNDLEIEIDVIATFKD